MLGGVVKGDAMARRELELELELLELRDGLLGFLYCSHTPNNTF